MNAAGTSDRSHPHQSCVSDDAKSGYLIRLVADELHPITITAWFLPSPPAHKAIILSARL